MTIAFRLGGAQLALLSLGFGLAGAFGAEHAALTGYVWRHWGLPTYDPRGFENWGIHWGCSPRSLPSSSRALSG